MNLFTILAAFGLLSAAYCVEEENGRILGALSTITHLIYATTTTTVPITCYTTIATTLCRRKRHANVVRRHLARSYGGEDPIELSGTLSTSSTLNRSPLAGALTDDNIYRKGRFAVTVWSSVTTTYTITETSTDPQTTYSVSFLCSVSGGMFPNVCG
ncbi:hypothetical protein FHG87_018691 [Trinorchestia longiramus]|nr:hypothetical protein FHG87_018691 [Trinorchestia longiramus]